MNSSFLFSSHCCSSAGNVYSCLCPFIPSNFGLWPSRVYFVVFQLLNRVLLLATPWTAARQASLSFHYLSEFAQTLVHWVSDAIQLSHPLLSPSPPALNLSNIKVLFTELVLCIRWPKYWSFSFSIDPSNEYSGLISFRIDWLDLLEVQGTLKSLLQHHS